MQREYNPGFSVIIATAAILCTSLSALANAEPKVQHSSIPPIPPLSARGLVMHFTPLKEAFLVAEPIYIYQWIENTTHEFQYYRWDEIREFRIIDEAGEEIPLKQGWFEVNYVAKPFVPGKGDHIWHAIPPKSSTGRHTPNILEHYGGGKAYMSYYLPPGRYALMSKLVASDTITFAVVAPVTGADIAASKRLIELYESEISWADPNIKIPLYESILTESPNSPYAPRILEELISLYQLSEAHRDSTKVQAYALQMIERFPTSPMAAIAFQDLDLRQLRETQRAALAKKLRIAIDSLTNTWMRRDIDSLLLRLER